METVKNRKHLSILLAILLVVTLTGQAALAFSMPCRGTSSCCCSTSNMDMTTAMPGGMDRNCCETAPEKPCDIQTTSPVSAEPYLSSASTGNGEAESVFQLTAMTIDPAHAGLIMASLFREFPDRGSPPVYLQNQSFLC